MLSPFRFFSAFPRSIGILSVLLTMLCFRTTLTAKHIDFTLSPQKITLKPGEQGKLTLTLSIEQTWYTYGMIPRMDKDGLGPKATEITLKANKIATLGKIIAPTPKQKFDQGFQIDIDYYEGTVVFTVPIKVRNDAPSGKYPLTLNVEYMVCDAQRCLPADDKELAFTLEIQGDGIQTTTSLSAETPVPMPPNNVLPQHDTAVPTATVQAQTAQLQNTLDNKTSPDTKQNTTPQPTTESQQEIAAKRNEGIWAYLWFAMGAGATALLTPCVFPMVPITISFFTKRAEKKRSRGVRDSIVYALGIMFTFTAIGFVLSLLFGATGISDFAANPWVNLALAGLFILLAFNLFGSFEIPLPTGLLNRMNNAAGDGDSIGAVLLMAITFSITSFTCTVPFVGAALISASSGEWFYPIVGMIGFSGVFALPFVVLALFPSAMARLPKAGGWMNNVKVVMGFLEIAAAMKFVSNSDLVWAWGILSREVFLAIWIGCAVLIMLYVLGLFRFAHDAPVASIGAPRAVFALVFASVTFYLVSGLFGKKLGELDAFLPPSNYEELIRKDAGANMRDAGTTTKTQTPNNQALSNQATSNHSTWLTSYEAGLEEAKRTGKPVFIDFTGFTCTNCRWMEANIFPMPEVQGLMRDMVKVQLFTDRKAEPYLSHKKRQLEQFGTIELPLYVLLKPDGTVLATKAFTRDRQEFIGFLKKAL
jgi:thiol:disulfide interchange protein DsbD